jgi:hypothetical protein
MVTREVITLIASILGITFGAVSLAVSLLNYLRDRSKLEVRLQWDMEVTSNPVYDPSKKWGLVTVTNVGRRPVYVNIVAVKMPRGAGSPFLLLRDSLSGQKLSEGDQPYVQVVNQAQLVSYAAQWKKMRAIATDSTGREYKSRLVRRMPSWAAPEHPAVDGTTAQQ